MKIKDFLERYPKRSTRDVYRAGIYDFLDSVYGRVRKGQRATEEERAEYERLADQYFNEQRDRFEDMVRFAAYMQDKPPLGARAKIGGARELLIHYDVEFTAKQLKRLSMKLPKGKTARTAEKDLDKEVLKRILMHLDVKGRACVLTLASSGIRIGVLMRIRLSDVDLSTTPAEMVIRGEHTKTGDQRTVFISSEAKEALEGWLKVRDNFLSSAENKNRGLVAKANARPKPRNDDRLFPYSERNLREAWDNALKKAELWNKDGTTGRNQVRIHAFRRFFRSQLALSCPYDIVEALVGHEGYLTEAYRRYPKKQMAEYYLKAEHHVTVQGAGDLLEVREQLKDTRATVKGYKDLSEEQTEEIQMLRQRVEELEAKANAADLKKLKEGLQDPEVQALLLKLFKELPERTTVSIEK